MWGLLGINTYPWPVQIEQLVDLTQLGGFQNIEMPTTGLNLVSLVEIQEKKLVYTA